MSDTPAGSGGREESGEETPPGPRRSTFTPPPADAPSPGFFDDDALAAAMEAEVRPYTSPIQLPVLEDVEAVPSADAAPEPVVAAESLAPEPVSADPEPAPVPEPVAAPGPVAVPEPVSSESQPEPVPEPVAPVDDAQLLRDLEGVSTVDAMQRLEQELARRAFATGPVPIAPSAPAFFAGEPPVRPPAPGPDPEPMDVAEPRGEAEPEAVSEPSVFEPPVSEPVVVAPVVFEPPAVEPSAVEPVVFEPPAVTPLAFEPPAAVADTPAPDLDATSEPVTTSEPEPTAATPEPSIAAAPLDAWDAAPPPGFVPPPPLPAPEGGRGPLGLLLPPPTDLPDVALRAELPPPPGYAEDGSSTSAVETPSALVPPAPGGWDQLFGSPAADRAPAGATAPVVIPMPVPIAETAVPYGAAPQPETLPERETAPAPAPAPEPAQAAPSAAPLVFDWSAVPDMDAENDDVVDEGDRVSPTSAAPSGPPIDTVPPAALPMPTESPTPMPAPAPAPEPAPVAVAEVPQPAPEPQAPPAFQVEQAGVEPTPLDRRAGRAARLFWLWFAANASVVSVGLGAVMMGMGMSLRQAVVAAVVGVALSFIPLGFGTLAGKWSGQPTMVVSRAAFGVVGNILPALLALVVRVFWGGVLVWLLADAVGSTLVAAHADAGIGESGWALSGLAAGVVLAAVVAVLGYGLLARVQLVLSILAGLVIVAAAVVSVPTVRLGVALTHQDGPWTVVVGGAVLVFSFVGLVWAQSGSDLARYQRPGGSGASSMLWATFGATIPPFLLIAWGALLAASSPSLAAGLASRPLATIAGLLPSWYPVPLLAAAAVGLLSGSVLTLYSGGFALQSLLPRVRRPLAAVVAAVLVLAVGAALVLLQLGTGQIVRDLAVTLAVPVAAWAGIFGAEMMMRQRRFHAPSLLATGGAYPAVRWINLVGLVVISAIGYGFVVGGQHWLAWEGWALRLLGVDAASPIAVADLGVLGALLLGILLPLATAVPAIRRQEAANAEPQDMGALPART